MIINFPNVGEFVPDIPNPFSSVNYADVFLRELKKSYVSGLFDDSLDIFLDNNPNLRSTDDKYPGMNNILLLYLHYSSLMISSNYTQSLLFSIQNDRIVELINESSLQDLMSLLRDLYSSCQNVERSLTNSLLPSEWNESHRNSRFINDSRFRNEELSGNEELRNRRNEVEITVGHEVTNNPRKYITFIHPHPIYHLQYKYGNNITRNNLELNIDKWLDFFGMIDEIFRDKWRRYWSLIDSGEMLTIIDSFVLCPASEELWEEYITVRKSIRMPLKTDSELLDRLLVEDEIPLGRRVTDGKYKSLTIGDEYILKDKHGPFIRCSSVLRNTFLIQLHV